MNDPIIHISNKTTTGSTKRRSLRRGSVLMVLAAAWFALSPLARAVNPPPDGGYPNANTAEGEDALSKLTIGIDNTAIGVIAAREGTGHGAVDIVRSSMQGTVLRVGVAAGDHVAAGQVLVVIEAMKMENEIVARHAGEIESVEVAEGDQVASGQALLRLA